LMEFTRERVDESLFVSSALLKTPLSDWR